MNDAEKCALLAAILLSGEQIEKAPMSSARIPGQQILYARKQEAVADAWDLLAIAKATWKDQPL